MHRIKEQDHIKLSVAYNILLEFRSKNISVVNVVKDRHVVQKSRNSVKLT